MSKSYAELDDKFDFCIISSIKALVVMAYSVSWPFWFW